MKTKNSFLAAVLTIPLLLGGARGGCQSPNCLWAKSAGGTDYDVGSSCSADANGNIFVTGYFRSSSITFGTTTLTNASTDTADIFIVKYDPSGNILWGQSAGGTSWDYGSSCSTDANGNIFVTGSFRSSSITFGTTTLTNAGTDTADIFIVKYDPSGNVLWAKSASGTSWDYGLSCNIDASGNVFVTGSFQSTSITFGTATLTNAGGADMFIVKYDSNGNVLWAKSAGGISAEVGNSCSADANGNVFVTGSFRSSPITFGTTTLTNAGWADIFIVKYDSSGNVLWANSAGGTDWEEGYSCSADATGNVFVTGTFYSSSITFGTTTLTNAGWAEIFIVKYDSSGNVLWAKSAGGTNYDYGSSCSTDAGGNIIATGYFSSPSITFGTTVLTNTNVGYSDMFIVKYDPSGNVLWAKSAGGNSYDIGYSCSADATGNIFVTGYFYSSSITFGTVTLTSAGGGYPDMFIVKYGGSNTGIDENNFSNEINIYPNPSTGIFTIKSSNNISEIKIINVLGEKIYSDIQPFNHSTINISNQPKGIYFLEIISGSGRRSKKFILQ